MSKIECKYGRCKCGEPLGTAFYKRCFDCDHKLGNTFEAQITKKEKDIIQRKILHILSNIKLIEGD